MVDPFDRVFLATKKVQHIAIAPKTEIEPMACTVGLLQLLRAAQERQWVYAFGAASYQDTSNSTIRHHVEFCLQSHGVGIKADSMGMLQEECEHHNCADDECQAQ